MDCFRVLRPILLKIAQTQNSFHSSAVCNTVGWRARKGLPRHRNAFGPLTDKPDYTFVDGRPTPLGSHQKRRMLEQQEYAKQIVKYCSELDSAIERRKKIIADREAERESILANRLKEKGHLLLKTY